MASSKEAWEHFVFVPVKPSRRLSRASGRVADHGSFLQVSRKVAVQKQPSGSAGQALAIVRSGRASAEDNGCRRSAGCAKKIHCQRNNLDLVPGSIHVTDACLVGASAAATALAVLATMTTTPAGPVAALLKVAMMAPLPPMIPPADTADGQIRPAGEDDGGRDTGQSESLLDLLLPNFDTNTFIWRMSMLQLTNYMASLLMGSFMGTPKLCSLYLLGASWGPSIAGGAIWRLFLPMLLHANAPHIFFNIFFQLRVGFGMEKQFGRRKFCLLYLFCGFFGNLMSVVANPYKLAVGASTSGFGLLGVWFAELLLTWEILGTSRTRLAMWFGFMVSSCIMMSTLSPNVDFMGHFGGAFAGFLLALILSDMPEDMRPEWYENVKGMAKGTTALLIVGGLFKAITLGPENPVPSCGTIFNPRILPF